jgi:hypothetical protein
MSIREFRELMEFDNPGGPTQDPPFRRRVIISERGATGKFTETGRTSDLGDRDLSGNPKR